MLVGVIKTCSLITFIYNRFSLSLLSQEQLTSLISIGETLSRIVVVYVKSPKQDPATNEPIVDGTEGIYKLELDKNSPIPDLERIDLLGYSSRAVPRTFYEKDIKVLSIITDINSDRVGIAYTIPNTNRPITDILFAGSIIGSIYQHCPLTPKPIGGKITNMSGKFFSDGEHFALFYNFRDVDNVDGLGWLGRH